MGIEKSYIELKKLKKLQKALDEIELTADEAIYLLKTYKGENGRIDNELDELMESVKKGVYKHRYYNYKCKKKTHKPMSEMSDEELKEYNRLKKKESKERLNGKTKC